MSTWKFFRCRDNLRGCYLTNKELLTVLFPVAVSVPRIARSVGSCVGGNATRSRVFLLTSWVLPKSFAIEERTVKASVFFFYDKEPVKFLTHYFWIFKTNFNFKANDWVTTALAPCFKHDAQMSRKVAIFVLMQKITTIDQFFMPNLVKLWSSIRIRRKVTGDKVFCGKSMT